MENIILNISKIYDVNRNYYWTHPNSPRLSGYGGGKKEPDNTYLFFIILSLIMYLLYIRINR